MAGYGDRFEKGGLHLCLDVAEEWKLPEAEC